MLDPVCRYPYPVHTELCAQPVLGSELFWEQAFCEPLQVNVAMAVFVAESARRVRSTEVVSRPDLRGREVIGGFLDGGWREGKCGSCGQSPESCVPSAAQTRASIPLATNCTWASP